MAVNIYDDLRTSSNSHQQTNANQINIIVFQSYAWCLCRVWIRNYYEIVIGKLYNMVVLYNMVILMSCRLWYDMEIVIWHGDGDMTWRLCDNMKWKSKEERANMVQNQGIARTQSPTNKNCAPESPTFGVIAAVSPTGVQWKGLTLGEPPNGSRYPLCQVSMLDPRTLPGFYLRIHNKTVSLFNSVCIFNHHVIIFSKLYITAISNACWRKHMMAVHFSV